MKKLIFNKTWLYLFALVSATFTSCLKDEGYENGEYGLKDVEGNEFVSIPKASKANSINVLAVETKEEPQELSLFEVSYDFVNPSSAPITVTVAVNNTLVTNYNSGNAADAVDYEVLPQAAYTLPSMTLTIPAGARLSESLKMVLNTNSIDPSKVYAIGFSIESVSPSSIKLPANLKNVIMAFAVKNRYDGRYTLRGYHNRDPYTFPYETEIHLVTNGPNEVYFYWPEAESQGHPIGVGPNNALSWYGSAISPSIKFDLATNKVTEVYNMGGATVITLFTGAGSRESKWDPDTRNIVVDWNYANNPLRAFFDDLEYIGPRP